MGTGAGFNVFLYILILINTYIYSYDIYEHSEILSLDLNYNITLLSKLIAYSNTIEINNKIFYYYDKNEKNFQNIIVNYSPIIYYEYLDDLINTKNLIEKYSNNISAIIINSDNSKFVNTINNIKDILIFIYNDSSYNNTIKEKYSYFNINNTCSIKISVLFTSDIISKRLSLIFSIFIFLLLIFWIRTYIKAKKNKENLFVHLIILLIILFYLIHSILFIKWTYSFNYENVGSNYTLFNILFLFIRFLLFFIKILIGFCLCIQLNIIELKEHYHIIKESKSPLIHLMIVVFILSFESYSSFLDNPNIFISTSEMINIFYYLFVIIIFFYRYKKIKNIIIQRIINSFPERYPDLSSLLIKKKILYKHCYCLIILDIIIILMYLIITFLLNDYKNMKMSVLLLHYFDILFLIGLIIVYFPMKINNYYIEYSFLEDFKYFKNKKNKNDTIIYKNNIYNDDNDYDEEENINLLIKNDLKLFLVENPDINESDINNKNEDENSDKKYIKMKNMKIGYIYNELDEEMYNELKLIISLNQKQ